MENLPESGDRPFQPISPFAQAAFTGVIAPTKRSDFCMGIVPSSLPPPGLPSSGPMQTSLGKSTGCPAAPAPITAPASVGFWALRSETRSPGRSGLHRGSLSFGAAVRLELLLHTASRRQGWRLPTVYPCVQLPPARGCYQLARRRTFTSNPVPMPGTPPRRTENGGLPHQPAEAPLIQTETVSRQSRPPLPTMNATDAVHDGWMNTKPEARHLKPTRSGSACQFDSIKRG